MFIIVITKEKHLTVNFFCGQIPKTKVPFPENYLIFSYHTVQHVRQSTIFMYFHQMPYVFFIFLPYIKDCQTLKVTTILAIAFPFHGVYFKSGIELLRMY